MATGQTTLEGAAPTTTGNGAGVAEANQRLLMAFSKALLPALAAVLVLVVVGIVALFIVVARQDAVLMEAAAGAKRYSIWPQTFLIFLVQVGVGMIMGLTCLFLGTVMCWFGVTGAFALSGEGAGAKVTVQSAQVGIVLLIGGVLLVIFSLMKTVHGDITFGPGASPAGAPVPAPAVSAPAGAPAPAPVPAPVVSGGQSVNPR